MRAIIPLFALALALMVAYGAYTAVAPTFKAISQTLDSAVARAATGEQSNGKLSNQR